MKYRLGKKPARYGAIKFGFTNYFDKSILPTPPKTFGNHIPFVNWGMFGNDQWGDCVWAGAAHETMKWASEVGRAVNFSTNSVLAAYTAVTGFNPSNPDSDQGTDMQEAASYRRKTGLRDADGLAHKIDAYVAIEPGDIGVIATGTYLLGATGIGLRLPDSAEKQFDDHQPFDVVPGAHVEGGHYVPCLGRNSAGNMVLVTWGRTVAATPAFLDKYMDEGIAYLNLDRLKDNLSPDQIAIDDLRKDLAALAA